MAQLRIMTAYEQFQLTKYGNILPDTAHTPEDQLAENGIEELTRLAEWIERMNELNEVNYADPI